MSKSINIEILVENLAIALCSEWSKEKVDSSIHSLGELHMGPSVVSKIIDILVIVAK